MDDELAFLMFLAFIVGIVIGLSLFSLLGHSAVVVNDIPILQGIPDRQLENVSRVLVKAFPEYASSSAWQLYGGG